MAKHWKTSGEFTVAVASAMPAENYNFRPNPEEMSFGELVAHIGGANLNACANAGNTKMPASVYPDATTRATAVAIAKAKNVAFDMSDQQPASFGATVGQGEWGLFQDFLRNPTDVNGTASKLESAAAKAYKSGK